jgi:N-acetylglucosaminyl-diphospho-decaprenol L-rhamnosyltransferase
MMDLIVQIVNFRSRESLGDLLVSLLPDLEASGLSFEIVVADNNSGDDLSGLAGQYADKPISLFQTGHNGGFGFGHNFLFSRAKPAKALLLLNPDCKIIEPLTIRRLWDVLWSVDCAAVGPLLVKNDGPQAWDHGELTGWKARIAGRAGGSYWCLRNTAGKVAWVSGAVFLIKRQAFEEIGGFDENFFLFKEEEDLCLRLREAGWNIWYEPSVTVFHAGSGSGAAKDKYMSDSVNYFTRKHTKGMGRIGGLIYRICTWAYYKYQLWE